MIYSDQLHMCRCTMLEMAALDEKDLHINAIRNKLVRFIDLNLMKDVLDALVFSGEIVHLGMGWYRLASPVYINDVGVSIGCQHAITDNIFKNSYQNRASKKVGSLNEWLGLPFVFDIFDSIISYSNVGQSVRPVGSSDVYWADLNTMKYKENWLDESEFGLPEQGLIRVHKKFQKDFYQKNSGSFLKITPNQAYELAALKDLGRGLKVPLKFLGSSDRAIDIQQIKYMPKSLHLLSYLLADGLFRSQKRTIYRFTKESFDRFQSLSKPYINFV